MIQFLMILILRKVSMQVEYHVKQGLEIREPLNNQI